MTAFEGFVFAGTDWNDFTNFRLQEFDPGIAPKRFRWISGADSDGAVLPEEAHYDNAEMTVRIRVTPQTSMDNALSKLGDLVKALQECEKNPLGSAAVWTPASSTKSLTAYVVGGEVTGLPIVNTGEDAGWFLRKPAPVITMKLYRRPFLYGAEVTSAATVTNTNRFQLLTVASVPGDIPAEARLVVTDGATQSRRHVEWGLEQRYYNAATNLSIDTFVISGFAGTSTTRAGSFNTNVMRGTLTVSPVAICGVGNLSHVGSFRVKARVYAAPVSDATASDFKVRLSWKEGDGPLRSNDYTAPVATGGWSEVDLGLISIPEKTLGTQRWTGQIEAYSEDPGDIVDVDYLLLIPTEGYGKGRAPVVFSTPTTFSARDEFDQTAGNLNGKTLPIGGTWATSGAATDLAVEATGHTAQRAVSSDADRDTSGRYALAGLTTFTNCLAQCDVKMSTFDGTWARAGVIVRYVDVNNWFRAAVETSGGPSSRIVIDKRIAGTRTVVYTQPSVSLVTGQWYTIQIYVGADGRWVVWLNGQGSEFGVPLAGGFDSVLATGGTLESGKVGIYDAGTATD